MDKVKEGNQAITAEFYTKDVSDKAQLRVRFNNKVYSWDQFVKLATIDSEAKKVYDVARYKKETSGFEGELWQYVAKEWRHLAAPNDIVIKTGTGGKPIITVDNDEVERVKSQPPQPPKPRLNFD